MTQCCGSVKDAGSVDGVTAATPAGGRLHGGPEAAPHVPSAGGGAALPDLSQPRSLVLRPQLLGLLLHPQVAGDEASCVRQQKLARLKIIN